MVVLRSLSTFQAGALPEDYVRDLFPMDCAIYHCRVGAECRVLGVLGTPDPLPGVMGIILGIVADLELRAILSWSEGVWSSSSYHFVLPSGEHAGTFVRVGDACSDWLNVSRIADWLESRIGRCTALIADTPTLLPLLQELENRALHRWNDSRTMKRTLSSYYPSRDELQNVVSDSILWVNEGGGGIILVFVSVNASGGVLGRIESAFSREIADEDLRYIILCETNANSRRGSLCTIPVIRYGSKTECSLCHANSTPVEIDQQRFTTRVLTGLKTHILPKARDIMNLSRLIPGLDAADALRVHVTRPDHHSHLGIYIDPKRALMSTAFAQEAVDSLTEVTGGVLPDIAIIPAHKQESVIESWLVERGINNIVRVPLSGEMPSDVSRAIAKGSRILIADNAIITGHTVRGLYQAIQTAKGTCSPHEYDVLGFAIVSYISDIGTWEGIRQTFFTGTHRLATAFEVYVPEWGFHCPWCVELRALEGLASAAPPDAAEYITRRRERLGDVSGLTKQLFLGSELFDDREASRTTPKSFWGDVTDIGAFVGATTAFHQIRCTWSQNLQSLITRAVFPTASILRRYRDPVLAASMLRAARPGELWASENQHAVERALHDAQHARQHPVMIAEILWAAYLQKLPPQTVIRALSERLPYLPAPLKSLFGALLDSDLNQSYRMTSASYDGGKALKPPR